MTTELTERLSRYSKECIAEHLDPDYALAVEEAIHELSLVKDAMRESIRNQARLERELKDCKNTLCIKCGAYANAHLGACNGCKWYD